MTLILDAGGISALVQHRARLHEIRNRGLWPAVVPSIVLTEALTGDHRRDFHVNRLLRACLLSDVEEHHAREAARLRTLAARRGVSAVDAIVVAMAAIHAEAVVLTSDPHDLRALARHAAAPVHIAAV